MTLRRYLSATSVRSAIDYLARTTESDMSQPRVLSIQSHVVSGYCGNKSATFPLQLLGFDVDPINSVQFSNHTGYKVIKGQVLSDKDLGDLADGLSGNDLDRNYSHLLTGYIGSTTFLKRVGELVRYLKERNGNLIYVCDPVMGDNGSMYVPKELLPIYKNMIIPLADIITPNQFELELLTDHKICDINDAWKAIDILHEKGCQTVVVSSSDLGNDQYLLGLASTKSGAKKTALTINIPRLPANFTGTGDLFASLFLAWTHKTKDIQVSLEKTIATIQSVLDRTLKCAKEGGMTAESLELKLIQSKCDIEDPKVHIKCKAN